MSQQFTIEIPDYRAQYMREIADLTGQPIETIVAEAVVHPIPPADSIDMQIERVTAYSDAQLWAIIKERFPASSDVRLKELTQFVKAGSLPDNLRYEFDNLLELYGKYDLLRAKTLVELQQRHYPIDVYLKQHTQR